MAGFFKTGIGAADAGIAAAQAGTLAVPQTLIAIRMCLRALAAELLHQAALFRMSGGAGLEFVILVARAPVMHQLIGKKSRTPIVIEMLGPQAAMRQCRKGFGNPVGMGRTAGDVDHRQTRGVAKLGAEQATGGFAVILQAAGVGRIHSGRRDATPRRTTADGDYMPGAAGDLPNPVDHRLGAPAEAMKAARAARTAQQRTFDA